MLARIGLVGKKSSRPYLGPSEAIFSIGLKNPKKHKILPIFSWCANGPYSPGVALAAVHPRWGDRSAIYVKNSREWQDEEFAVQKIKKIKILKIQICSTQNVGKVWIGRKKSSWPYHLRRFFP